MLTEGDRAALETALRLRDAATGVPVSIEIATVAMPAAATQLREALSLGVDRVHLVAAPGTLSADSAANALATALRELLEFDLILGGAGAGDAQEGLLARLTGEAMGISWRGNGSADCCPYRHQ